MSEQVANGNASLWRRLVESNKEYSLAFRAFCASEVSHVPFLHIALRAGGIERMTALTVIPYLTVPERLELFSDLVHVARGVHSPFEAAWKIILSLPRDWVMAHIEQEVESILCNEEEDDYFMFLQLYDRLDRDLTLKLARRAAAHSDPAIRELGEDYLEKFREPQVSTDQSP